MGQNTDNNATAGDNRAWLISLVLVCLGVLAYGYLYSTNAISDFAFLFGYNLPIGLIIWGVFQAAFGRKHGNQKAGLAFVVIFGSLIASGLIGYSQRKSAATQMATEVQKDFATMISSGNDPQGLPQRIERQIDTTPTAKGEFGEMERFMKTFMNQITSQRNDYLLELDAIGWGKILDPERVRADSTLVESKITVKRAKDIVAKYRSMTYGLLENARQDIGNLTISESSRRDMLNGFQEGMVSTKAQIDGAWDMEAQAISEFGKMFALLSARNGAWVVQGGQILFANGSDLNAFNSYVASVQELVRKQEAIQKQIIETVRKNLSNIKH